jgi:hypothetical protein
VGGAHGIDEELLADRKTHRKCAEKRAAEGVAPAPMAIDRRVEVNQQSAHHQFGHDEILTNWPSQKVAGPKRQ